ncbi:hypothetical protein BT67DRAFT_465119 [Trichocladium antarcticum]|uniref:Septation initiation network scaffold protein cdc11 n=1 Tax=Trichocladium antarcticum TaxID=1450529 RepID=A0AAN6ZA71_9PEZI|nr:hypothetical protein BT67DRAFT_465119 [Trichocladium antarcticum]
MGHAWLDSLSEDWVSQPGSEDASLADMPEVAPSPDPKPKTKTPGPASRIPRLSPRPKRSPHVAGTNSNSNSNSNSSIILSERSINERFALAASRRSPSKLSQELSLSNNGRDCHACRSASVSTTNSVVHNSFLRKSAGPSPAKGRAETPEWKRRLVYGDLSYGEQRDLFTSAGTGLENIFKPPALGPGTTADGGTGGESGEQESPSERLALPSSPPFYLRDPPTAEILLDDSQQLPQRASTSTRYGRAEDGADSSRGSERHSCSHAGSEQTRGSAGLTSESRKISGRSELRYEDFSPILLERRQASNGKTIFGPAALPPDELRKRLETLQQSQVFLTVDANEGATDGRSADHAKSANSEATDNYFSERPGGFINFQRGGRSDDGSFRNHMLSSALNESSELNPEESLQASTPKQFPTVRVERWATADQTPADSPDAPPRAPDPSPEKRLAPVQGGTSSPLKLFQPYDTFTNQTLLRRLSHYEEAGDDSFSIAQVDTPSRLLSQAAREWTRRQASILANRFGAGELDGYEFHDEFSHISDDASGMDGDKENRGPEDDSVLASHPHIFDLSLNSIPSEAAEIVVHRRRQQSAASHASRRSGRVSFPFSDTIFTTRRRRDTAGSEIKRPRTSPSKDPTPKRRRTLHRSDVSYGIEDDVSPADSVQLSHKQLQSGLGRLRQEAHSGDEHEMADAELGSARQSQRPRTPTPNQRSSQQRDRQPLAEIERSAARSSRHSQPPAALAAGATQETSRKPSIKTEDFINEANKIMAMIRSKAGLASGLASLEESDEERGQQSPDFEDSYQESTQEPFSRPPSREGRPPLTRKSTKQEDPELVERLKKYEEASDMGDMITSSVRSAGLRQEDIRAAREQESASGWDSHRSGGWLSDDGVVSDMPNVRLSRNPDWHERQAANSLDDGVPSHGATGPPTQSTGVSFPTASSGSSSRGSEARKTIAPESVLHLIPDQVGNMILDRQRNIWVKRKQTTITTAPPEVKRSFFHSEMSEDDPFADIPDLSVDITTEMQNLKLTRNAEHPPPANNASPLSLSRLPNLGLAPAESPTRNYPDPNKPASMRVQEEAVEHEISINEDRVNERRRLTISFSSPIASVFRNVAAEKDIFLEDASIFDRSADDLAGDLLPRGRRTVSIQQATARSRSAESRINSRVPLRHLSVRGQSLMARPVSRIEERDEESVFEQGQYQEAPLGMELSVLGDYSVANRADRGRQTSLSFLLATPAKARECLVPGGDANPIISQYVGTYSLSPLSEFTMRHADETLPLEVSYVVDNHRLVTGDQSKRVMSMSMRDLVDKLAEVEPFEPYWEDMRELDLRGKGLNAVQALDEFCGQLESLDVSNNNIRNLAGIPSSVLHLRMMHNQLSSLTAWGHLMNLQYIDVSNNHLTSLAAFASLVHLRSLRADNNQISSLDGIKFHKGLQTLRVRGNLVRVVNLEGSTLHQLTDLDLKANKIHKISHLALLPALATLNLECNALVSFSPESTSPLRYLRLDDNALTSLNIGRLPHLRLLHADRNRLSQIRGFSRARRVDSLSLREQRGPAPLDVALLLAKAYEVRKLYLSGNLVGDGGDDGGFAPPVDLLNLQLLELANCGLTRLPPDLGLCLPNLRVVNLNLNALRDLRGLAAVPRLKRLYAAGNRLADPAAVVDVLRGFAWLAAVDLRDNPVTQGFYAPAVQIVVRGEAAAAAAADGEEETAVGDPFVLPAQDAARDRAYCGRLDMDTRVRRRVYEGLLGARCRRVVRLDGLVFEHGKEGGVGVVGGGEGGGDTVWQAMREKGLVTVRDGAGVAGETRADVGGRWPAEDSFA